MRLKCISEAELSEAGFSYTLSLIKGKYKMIILYCLIEYDIVRYNKMKRYIKTISHKTPSLTLKKLEMNGLVYREEYTQIPPKVEYRLTQRGKSLMPILDSICGWSEQNRNITCPEIEESAEDNIKKMF